MYSRGDGLSPRKFSVKAVLSNEPGYPPGQRRSRLESNLHSPERRLIELRMEHADLDALVDRISNETPIDELLIRRLKKRRLALRDLISRLEAQLDPQEPA